MAIVNGRRIDYSLEYEERNGCWAAHIRTSNRHGFTKRFKTAKQANEWYDKFIKEQKNPFNDDRT